MSEKLSLFQRYLIEGLVVGAAVYIVTSGRLEWSEILLIALTSMIFLALLDRFHFIEPFSDGYSSRSFLPPGGVRSEILPLTIKNPQTLSIEECRKIDSYLTVNPIERVNNNRLKDLYIQCKEKIAKHVQFNDRVQTVSSTGSIDSESLVDGL